MKGKILILGICLAVSLSGMASGQEYPSKPIECVVGYPPGGVSDTTFRVLCKAAEKHLNQPLPLVNKPGVSGALSLSYIKEQKPDGYQLCYSTAGALIFVPYFEKVGYKAEDFTYIMGYGYQLHGLTVRADAPWNTFPEFLGYAKKNAGKVKYGTYSPVSSTYIAMDLIAQKEGLDWTHIPYKGDNPGITALLGGHIDALASASGQIPYIRSGKLKFLAVFNSYPSPSFPGVPTLKALGYTFPMVSDITTSQGVIAPPGMKPEMVKKLEGAFLKAGNDPSFVKIMETLECPLVIRKGEEYRAEIMASQKVLEKLIPPIAAKIAK